MKKIYKILLFTAALIGLAASAAILSVFFPVPYLTQAVTFWQREFIWINGAFALCCAVMCLVFLLAALIAAALPAKRDLLFNKDGGKLAFSRQTVESTVRYSFAELAGINSSKVRAKIKSKPEKTRIYVKLSLSDPTGLVDLTGEVRKRVEDILRGSLGLEAKSIDIKVAQYSGAAAAEKNDDPAKERRVV